MASTEGPARAHDRHGRRRPFANWMKRLANLKSLHVDSGHSDSRRSAGSIAKGKKIMATKHHPYQFSHRDSVNNGHLAFSTPISSQRSRSRHSSGSYSKHSIATSHNEGQTQSKSRAPTLGTTAETTISDTGRSGAGTTYTTGARTDDDRDSTFSSPAHSVRSMTTTLTTLQSTVAGNNQGNQSSNNTPTSPFPPSQPATAIPSHLAPSPHPATYHTATANNILTDDASVLTLASSSKRRRRNSLDTNASIRALAPASVFGGSRESLPLSVLSGTVINPGGLSHADNGSIRGGDAASSYSYSNYYPRSTSVLNAERASLISASGVTAPALASERNSYISTTKIANTSGTGAGGDNNSVRSGLYGSMGGGGGFDRDVQSREQNRDGATSRGGERGLTSSLYGHGRNDSIGGVSIGAASLLIRERREEKEREQRERERDRDRDRERRGGEEEKENRPMI